MDDNLFTVEGHIAHWVFFPPAWGGQLRADWRSGFTDSQLEMIYNHMQECIGCRQREIDITLKWIDYYTGHFGGAVRINVADNGGRTKLPEKVVISIVNRIILRCRSVIDDCNEAKKIIGGTMS